MNDMNRKEILFVEPFYGGSHKQLIDVLINSMNSEQRNSVFLVSLSGKKWHWRARVSALYISQIIPQDHSYEILFASSILNLAELVALRPDLSNIRKVIYFHENQLVYPVRKHQDRDFQYGYNQILTSLVADIVIFNSKYNFDSFLNSINKFIKLQPDYRPCNLKQQILPKCEILHFPLQFPSLINGKKQDDILHIVWPHRWEHDKGPETLFEVLLDLASEDYKFQVSVFGESFSSIPDIFETAHATLGDRIKHWGFASNKLEYFEVLNTAHIVVSTAKHEFFGVAMLEAVYCGCFPLCPNDLVYPELYPSQCLYNDIVGLKTKLREFCIDPKTVRDMRKNLVVEYFKQSFEQRIEKYKEILFHVT